MIKYLLYQYFIKINLTLERSNIIKKLICSLMVGIMIFGTVSSVAGAVPYKKTDKGLIAEKLEKIRQKNHEKNLRRAIEINWDELFPNILGTPVVSESSSGSGSPDSSIMGDGASFDEGGSSIMEDAIAMLSPIRPRVRCSSIMGDGASVDGGESSIMGDDASFFDEGESSIMRDGASFDEGGSSIMR